MTSPAPPRRRWFRFSLRTLFAVFTGATVGVFIARAMWNSPAIYLGIPGLGIPVVGGPAALVAGAGGLCWVGLTGHPANPFDIPFTVLMAILCASYFGVVASSPRPLIAAFLVLLVHALSVVLSLPICFLYISAEFGLHPN